LAGSSNVTGDEQKKLDVISNEIFVNSLKSSGKVSVMVSEENENAIILSDTDHKGRYCVVFDPLDGSSNIEAGVSIGTIFGVYQVVSFTPPSSPDFGINEHFNLPPKNNSSFYFFF